MNNVTDLLRSHRSIRKYTEEPISEEVLEDILSTSQWAPSSHNTQAYSIITIKDQQKKQKLSTICRGQKYVANCAIFLVFCVDYYRVHLAAEMNDLSMNIEETNDLVTGAVDAALVGENVLIAARSHGIGGVMIGEIRNNLAEVADLLQLPPFTFPLFGMCLGYPEPTEIPGQKPRLPTPTAIHSETYKTENMIEELAKYEIDSASYYTKRTNGLKTTGWTKQISTYMGNRRNIKLKEFILKQGFDLK
ncbi:NADPH-flavin oxidoreductase [Halalkalibacter wakoensis JCM 9140]|uniref:NADPH-flavin oxidoreductase n=1 Tax=Halalkalibacter wakoensis JCM 9140 TaxID=1236970 RepID=W4Q0Q5_9BACI|nr:oxygen-insensitive NADPH nitroreductase [Halalkalibacter wakoensis]GAE25520.1 NADPH-flavin oxidoreductase [Halalkalibacter wakoensis JCM 9140]